MISVVNLINERRFISEDTSTVYMKSRRRLDERGFISEDTCDLNCVQEIIKATDGFPDN